MVKTCPHCGSVTHHELFSSKIHQRIYDFIKTHPDSSRDEVLSAVYAEDPNGGPESINVISVHITRMNKQLRPKGLKIQGRLGSLGGYRVLPLEPR